MKVIIVGANYNNKGAQSMLYVTVSEIKKSYPDCEVYFATHEYIDDGNLKFKRLLYTYQSKKIALSDGLYFVLYTGYVFIKSHLKNLFKKGTNFKSLIELKKILPSINAIIDVSGFALGERFSIENQKKYLDNIYLAKKYDIPMYLMPQSFGPFENNVEEEEIIEDIKSLLRYPRIIFAREREGYNILKNDFKLDNVVSSTDLVLQNSGVKTNEIFINEPNLKIPSINTEKKVSVAIVPNEKCFKHGNRENILYLYKRMIELLLDAGKVIYVFRHSREDLKICISIKEMFSKNENVKLLENEFSCFEYEELIKNFDFVICSRFHGIVHAYRNGIPCIALGWSIKYRELTRNVGQGDYAFDIISGEINYEKILGALENIMKVSDIESENIKKRVAEIQKDNCFDLVRHDIENIPHSRKN